MKTSALLINHNSGGTILKAIQSLIDQTYPLQTIMVVDNGSTDGTIEVIRNAFPPVQLMELGENRGLSYARNFGLSHLTSELVLLVDDDVYLSTDALQKMVDALRETGAVIVCPRIVLYPEITTIQCDGARIHFSGTLALCHAYEPASTRPPERVIANGFIGACLLADRETLMSAGGFDEDYFFYFEDLELSYRLRGLGYEICCEENAIAHHERGQGTQNLSFRGSGLYPTRRAYFNLRNRWLTTLIHYQTRTLFILFPILLIYEFAAFILSVKRGWLSIYFKVVFSLLSNLPSILKRRAGSQSTRKVMDRDILSGGELPLSRGFVRDKDIYLLNLLNRVLNTCWIRAKRWL